MSDRLESVINQNETASRIFEAADRLMCERGFEGTSMGAVAKEAGVNKALVFYYFNSKDELFELVLDRYYEAHSKALGKILEVKTDLPPRERFHRMIDAYLDFMSEHIDYPALVQQEIARKDGHHSRIRENLKQIFGVLKRALEDIAPETGPLSAKHFYISMSGMVLTYYTYAPVLTVLWGGKDPLAEDARSERREHIHWMVDTMLNRLLENAGRGE